MPSLKREEAITRYNLLRVESYDVDLDLTKGDDVFGSTTSVRFDCREPGSATFIDIDPHTLKSVTLNGQSLDVGDLKDGRFRLANLAVANVVTVVADMAYSHDGEGMHRFTDPADGLTYTYMMGFLDMACRVFACFEQPDLKAPYRLTVTAGHDWTVVANEAGARTGPGRWEFTQTKPLATYFVTVVAGPYHSIYRDRGGVRFGLHARRSLHDAVETDADEIFGITFGCWDRLHELYGVRYAFGDTYDQCFVPEFNAGAMENPGCVTFRDDRYLFTSAEPQARRDVRSETIAHEMAHMWFGNLVTMKWWDDLWLNEAFANCMGYRAAEACPGFSGARANAVIAGAAAYHADELPSTHPVSGAVAESRDALNNFDAISYDKGGVILDQLAATLGEEAFFRGLREYFDTYRFGNASLRDFVDCMSRAGARDLTGWAEQWLSTTGPNTLRLETATEAGSYRQVAIVQTAPDEHPTLRPHHVRVGAYRVDGDRMVCTDRVDVDVASEFTAVPQLTGTVAADLLLPNDGASTFAKVRLDADGLAAIRPALNSIEDDVPRSVLWTMLTDMVEAADLPVLEYLDIIADTLVGENRTVVLQQQLGFARTSVDCYVPDSERESTARTLVRIARGVRQHADVDSGARLAGLRAEIDGVRDASDVAWLGGMLSGHEVPAGIVIDDDLRWRILLRLAVLGEAHERDIDDELERDPSSRGHKHAATCRAARPLPAAKEAAWRSIMTDRSMSNHLLRATAEGFFWPEQTELTRDFVSRFFAEAAPIHLANRSPWEAKHLTRALFPRYSVDEPTIALAQGLARDDELHPIVRRAIVDLGSDLRLAWRVRGRRLRSRRG